MDTLRAESLSRELVEAAPDHDLSMVRLPTLPYGYSEHHMNYAGTVTLSSDTYQRVIVEIGKSIAEHGAERLAVVNCHGGNNAPLTLAADQDSARPRSSKRRSSTGRISHATGCESGSARSGATRETTRRALSNSSIPTS